MARQEMYHIQHRFSKVNNGSRIVDRLMVEQTNISRQNGEMSHHNLGKKKKKSIMVPESLAKFKNKNSAKFESNDCISYYLLGIYSVLEPGFNDLCTQMY